MTEAQSAALRVASRLLCYPGRSWLDSLPALRAEAASLENEAETAGFARAALGFIDSTLAASPAASARRYVAIYDHMPAASLYMSWHRYGNDRSQGKAMGALNGLYRTAGFEPLAGEMPDYLPRMLEFLSVAPDWACNAALDGFGPEIAGLLKTLQDVGAAHAAFLELALEPLKAKYGAHFKPRHGQDPTQRPMAQPEPEPMEPLIPIPRRDG